MMHGSQPPRRMRYSVESRLRVVTLIEAGVAPAVAAKASGASRASAYRWGGGIGMLAGRVCVIARRCRVVSRGACRWKRRWRSWLLVAMRMRGQ
jgi:hypothetical protein